MHLEFWEFDNNGQPPKSLLYYWRRSVVTKSVSSYAIVEKSLHALSDTGMMNKLTSGT